jgi:hypothetical protein
VTWATFAGQFEASALASFGSAGDGWKVVDVSALLSSWRAGSVANHGLLIRDAQAPEDQFEEYGSSEDSEAGLRPKLVICLE